MGKKRGPSRADDDDNNDEEEKQQLRLQHILRVACIVAQ